MLCSVLLNCPTLRHHIFQQWAALCDWKVLPLDKLVYEIETEQAVGGKRDDLRIVGYRSEDESQTPVLLWTIEIKVQAGIHHSSHESYDEEDEPVEVITESVTQLENYDRWLEAQNVTADRKAGLVLAMPSYTQKVNELIEAGKLKPRWHCLRWTDLGGWIEQQLADKSLPAEEQLLAEHLLGFVLKYLQDPSEMTEHRIDIEDLALIRAYAQQGNACAKRIHNLVSPVLQIFDESGITLFKQTHQKALFRPSVRSVVYGYLKENGKSKPAAELILWAGIHQDQAKVWIEVQPSASISTQVRAVVSDHLEALQSRNPAWQIPAPEESTWRVVHLCKPLAWLLVEDDQPGALAEFVRGGLEDLTVTGVVDAIQAIASPE
ncbi:hypothetical protein C5Y96_10585 [Blastopirellula marina]|uniref:Uncharacterized protein n=2 Tax=Pirellulales TaxID=2691354 RepID=A0A2S8FM64_9BACT|nr:hypothetical protein C5Y96_10585 [Blastopirellula marina]RCS52378.1 hypothetical protein DTL36_10595 [Bremerella cremea]